MLLFAFQQKANDGVDGGVILQLAHFRIYAIPAEQFLPSERT